MNQQTPQKNLAKSYGLLWITFAIGCVVSVAASCGVFEPEYKSYREANETPAEEPGGGTTLSPECQAALTEFETQIQPAIDGSCSCHTQGTAPTLTAANSEASRDQILAHVGTDHMRLFRIISNDASEGAHGGGDKKGDLPEENIQAWADKEAGCT